MLCAFAPDLLHHYPVITALLKTFHSWRKWVCVCVSNLTLAYCATHEQILVSKQLVWNWCWEKKWLRVCTEKKIIKEWKKKISEGFSEKKWQTPCITGLTLTACLRITAYKNITVTVIINRSVDLNLLAAIASTVRLLDKKSLICLILLTWSYAV